MGLLVLPDRFWAKVDKSGDCWVWTGALGRGSYGMFAITPQRHASAHRLSYQSLVAEIPAGLTIDHLCRNARCVNPQHLEAVTQRENSLRSTGVTAINAAKTHCHRGHPFDEANTWHDEIRGHRHCRACGRERKSMEGPVECGEHGCARSFASQRGRSLHVVKMHGGVR